MWNPHDYQKTTISLILLKLLHQGDKSGVQLVEETRAATDNAYSAGLGSLFAVLHPMEAAGYITIDKKNRPIRYHLTQKGQIYLLNSQKEFQLMEQGIRKVFRHIVG